MSDKARTFSARWSIDVLDRLERRSRQLGLSRSRVAERFVDEGLKMTEHPGIVFRDGPAGRRASLIAGPDVWEVMMTLRSFETKGDALVADVSELLGLSEDQVRIAVRYYARFPKEIDERIQREVEGADAAEAAWKREQVILG